MTQLGYLIEPSVSAPPKSIDPRRLCAYSVTRQRFLCAEVEADDFSKSALDSQLLTLVNDSAKGLWLCPFCDIPPTSLSVPVDLIYLDRNCIVLETVESFPLARASGSMPSPESVLILPADSVSSTGTQRGDRLLLCPPGEMKRRLIELPDADRNTEANQAEPVADKSPAPPGTARVLRWAARKSSTGEAHASEQLLSQQSLSTTALPEKVPAPAELETQPAKYDEAAGPASDADSFELFRSFQPAKSNDKPVRSWLKKFLSPDPPEARKSKRESIEVLIAYFFTGGAPASHKIRDISEAGVFVYTQERWYPGTMVRVTIADGLESNSEVSITLNTLVVRATDVGVGLRFILENQNGNGQQVQGMLTGAGSVEVQRFLQKIRNARA